MTAPVRLGLYGLVLVAVFAVAGFTANAAIPEDTVQRWAEDTADTTHEEEGDAMNGDEHEGTVPEHRRWAWASLRTATNSPQGPHRPLPEPRASWP